MQDEQASYIPLDYKSSRCFASQFHCMNNMFEFGIALLRQQRDGGTTTFALPRVFKGFPDAPGG